MSPDRYRRQKLVAWLGEEGQERLARSGVLLTRAGGLGGPLAQALALAGIGRIVFYHEGDLDQEDLHRMILMAGESVGMRRAPRAEAALRRLREDLDVRGFDRRLTREEADRWMAEMDLAVGAAPTYEERLLLNDAAVVAGKPFVDAAMYADEGHVLCVQPGRSACLRCVLEEALPWTPDFPVLGAMSALVGNLAAILCIRILAGAAGVPWGEFIHVNLESLRMRRVKLERRIGCHSCGAL